MKFALFWWSSISNVSSFRTMAVVVVQPKRYQEIKKCWANNVGSRGVRVGSGLQTGATTPNNVGVCSAMWEGYNLWDVMRVRGPSNVGSAIHKEVQTDPTLLRYASAMTERKKCWELLVQRFDWFQTLLNNSQQHATGCAYGHDM